mmetsp:Transcript_25726/g.38231  ORF Transcript_25726/g.38231 Transcript_25726/m.38231 type:complete len:238 (-) Transcript_25726:420-1133(-)
METTNLLNVASVAGKATVGATAINEAAIKVQKARSEGPLSYRILSFLGGLAMIVSNGISILDRFFSFNVAGALIAIYGVCFGVIITIIEGGWACPTRLQNGIRHYAKFLEFTWGRGMLYFFVGSLQASNWNILDWAVGGFMMFVGFTAVSVGAITAIKLRRLRLSISTEEEMKKQWQMADVDGNGSLDIKELSIFASNAGLNMTRNEIAAAFDAMDRNFDEKVRTFCVEYFMKFSVC